MFHPCALKTYKPCSVLTLQPSLPLPARARPDVPSAIAATRQPNAQVKAMELIIVLVNFGFIVIVSFCLSIFLFKVVGCLSLHAGSSFIQSACPCSQRRRWRSRCRWHREFGLQSALYTHRRFPRVPRQTSLSAIQ